jgi:hypothetical protein
MILKGTDLLTGGPIHRPFMVLNVEEDNARSITNEFVERRIKGTVKAVLPFWTAFRSCWLDRPMGIKTVDGVDYTLVNGLVVDWDHYGFISQLSVDNGVVHVLTRERFFDPIEDFQKEVLQRNAKVSQMVEKINSGTITRNDLREINGLPRRTEAFLNLPVGIQVITELKQVDYRLQEAWLHNCIV